MLQCRLVWKPQLLPLKKSGAPKHRKLGQESGEEGRLREGNRVEGCTGSWGQDQTGESKGAPGEKSLGVTLTPW